MPSLHLADFGGLGGDDVFGKGFEFRRLAAREDLFGGVDGFLMMWNHHFEEFLVVGDGHGIVHWCFVGHRRFGRCGEVFADDDGGDEDSEDD